MGRIRLLQSGRALMGLALAAALLLPSAAAAEAPAFLTTIEDLEVPAGSARIGAIDLALHFGGASGSELAFSVAHVDIGGAPAGAGVVVTLRGSWLDIAAQDTRWTGLQSFQARACDTSRGGEACNASNVFRVTVVPPAFGRGELNPPGIWIEGLEDGAGEAGSVTLATLAFSASVEVRSVPVWYLDGAFLGDGDSIEVGTLAPGPHKLEARFDTGGGPVVVTRFFETQLPPSTGGAGTWQRLGLGAAAASLIGAFGIAASARARRPLVLLLVAAAFRTGKDAAPLDHFNRGALYALIDEHPGIHFAELRRRTALSHGSAIHHLRALERAGYIRAQPVGAFTRYYASDRPTDTLEYGLSPAESTLLAAVGAAPGLSVGELAQRTGKSAAATSRAVTRLALRGYLITENSKRHRKVYPRPATAPHEGNAPVQSP